MRPAEQLDAIRRSMLPFFMGWTRVQGQEWREAMSRMKTQVTLGVDSIKPLGKQWANRHYSARQAATSNSWANQCISWTPTWQWQQDFNVQPWKRRGRPPLK